MPSKIALKTASPKSSENFETNFTVLKANIEFSIGNIKQ